MRPTGRIVERSLVAAERPVRVPAGSGPEVAAWTYAPEGVPVIRLQRGDRLRAALTNQLPEHTSIHWHGIRVPNAMDGVPYVTQPPVLPEQSFTYDFTPPDTGTFFFHSHCDTVTQLGRGLSGILLVEGDTPRPFDADVLCVLRDWRIDEAGGFTAFITDEGAGKAGTFGRLRTANDRVAPVLEVPAGGDVRLRILNVDATRICEVGFDEDVAAIIAVDGNALPPVPLASRRLGPAQRLDLALRAPAPGKELVLYDYFAAEPVPLARLRGTGPALKRKPFAPWPLLACPFAEPDLATAERMRLTLQQTAVAAEIVMPNGETLRYADALCLSTRTFWAMNQESWPEGGHQALPPPLLTLEKDRSYVIELVNLTQNQHPMHLHGITFVVPESDKGFPRHRADTVLLGPRDRIEIAFVADSLGDWMLHCHIIEHQETGMMGYVRVA